MHKSMCGRLNPWTVSNGWFSGQRLRGHVSFLLARRVVSGHPTARAAHPRGPFSSSPGTLSPPPHPGREQAVITWGLRTALLNPGLRPQERWFVFLVTLSGLKGTSPWRGREGPASAETPESTPGAVSVSPTHRHRQRSPFLKYFSGAVTHAISNIIYDDNSENHLQVLTLLRGAGHN